MPEVLQCVCVFATASETENRPVNLQCFVYGVSFRRQRWLNPIKPGFGRDLLLVCWHEEMVQSLTTFFFLYIISPRVLISVFLWYLYLKIGGGFVCMITDVWVSACIVFAVCILHGISRVPRSWKLFYSHILLNTKWK